MGCSPWGRKESDTTGPLHFHFSLSCIGEGNGNPLQCSCLENPRDGGAWWAAVYGVAQGQTRLKRLSSCSSSSLSQVSLSLPYLVFVEHLVGVVLVAQWCPTLCDPMNCSPPGSSAHGILQARTLEWVAMPFSRGYFQPTDQSRVSCIAGRFFTI